MILAVCFSEESSSRQYCFHPALPDLVDALRLRVPRSSQYSRRPRVPNAAMILSSVTAAALGLVAQALAASCTPSGDFQKRCASVTTAQLGIANATVWFSQFVPAGTSVSLPDNDPSCAIPFQVAVADMCRVSLYVATSGRSGISMEAWLPSNWNKRYRKEMEHSVDECGHHRNRVVVR